MKKKIVVIGTVYLDIKGHPFSDLSPDGRNAGSIKYVPGGVGRNVAQDLAGLGFHPVFVSLSEENPFGRNMISNLKESGVNTDYIITIPDGIGTWMAIFDRNGEVFASISKRQDLSPLIRVLRDHGEEIFRDCGGCLLEMDVEEGLVKEVFEMSQQYGFDIYGVISNMTIAKERLSYIQKTKCFICNKQEAQILFERDLSSYPPEELLDVVKEQMKTAGISCMVVTLDKDGSVFADTDREEEGICPVLSVNVVDSTGAGDAFFAGVSSALICGETLSDACRLGTRTAAAVLTTDENVYKAHI